MEDQCACKHTEPPFFVFGVLECGECVCLCVQKYGAYFGSDTSNSGSAICAVHTMPSYPLISVREAWDILAEPQLSVQLEGERRGRKKIQDTLSFHSSGKTKSQNGGLFFFFFPFQIWALPKVSTFFFSFVIPPPCDHIPASSELTTTINRTGWNAGGRAALVFLDWRRRRVFFFYFFIFFFLQKPPNVKLWFATAWFWAFPS